MVAKLGATPIWRIFGVARALQSVANFGELCHGEVRLSPGPVGEDFSGSCTVTSRNPLIHNGATNSTKSPRFDVKGVQRGLLSWGWRCVERAVCYRELPR